MSVQDPLLKRLKECVKNFTDGSKVTDENTFLGPFCQILEQILRKGLKDGGILSLQKYDYWECAVQLCRFAQANRLNPTLSRCQYLASTCPRVKSSQGRGRYFIRLLLDHRILHAYVQLLQHSQNFCDKWYDSLYSIVNSDILGQIFYSLLLQVSQVNFSLKLQNASFLDETWVLPVVKSHQLVPCSDIGIRVYHWQGRAFVSKVFADSVASEDDKIQPGDVIDELCSQCLRDVRIGAIGKLLSVNAGSPINITLVKSVLPSGHIFPPIAELIRSAGFDPLHLVSHQTGAVASASRQTAPPPLPFDLVKPPPHAQLPEDELDEVPVHGVDGATYKLNYLCSFPIGSKGGMDQIERVIDEALQRSEAEPTSVTLTLGETHVAVNSVGGDSSSPPLLSHSYPEISSCGRRLDRRHTFCYITGETTCTMARDFVAHVFSSRDEDDIKVILCAIAQGFDRTHWAV